MITSISKEDKIYSNKSQIELFRKEFLSFSDEIKAGFSQTKREIKIEIRKVRIWMKVSFFTGGSLMILIAKLFFCKIRTFKINNDSNTNF